MTISLPFQRPGSRSGTPADAAPSADGAGAPPAPARRPGATGGSPAPFRPLESGGLVWDGVTVRYRRREEPTVRDVGFALHRPALVAVVGPSGAGKSTLCAALTGSVEQVGGTICLDGVDLLQDPALLRAQVSVVPQRDALHDELTPRQALEFVADLRLGASVPAAQRDVRIDAVLHLLDLADHAGTRIGELSGGQRKRVAVAMELLSRPRVLVLDEPTSGLDEGLDRSVMQLLRRVVDGGLYVLVVTHSTANIGLADVVLALDVTGRVAYLGRPSGFLEAFGAADHGEAMQALRARGSWAVAPPTTPASVPPAPSVPPSVLAPPASRARRSGIGVRHGIRVLARRELTRQLAQPLTLARGVLLLPLLTAVLTALTSGRGLESRPQDPNIAQSTVLSVLVMCTVFFAMALSFSSVVGDRAVIDREARWGVSAVSVIVAKALVISPLVAVQSLIGYTLFVLVRPGPVAALDVPSWPVMTGCLILIGISAMAVGLLLSTSSPTLERAVFALLGATALLVVLNGILIPMADTEEPGISVLAFVAQFSPTRWGTAAMCAYLGFVPDFVSSALAAGTPPPPNDPIWTADASHVWTALACLQINTVIYLLAATLLLERQHRRRR